MGQEIINIDISDLKLWTENPRDPISIDSSDADIINKALHDDEKKWKLQKLLDKMGSHYDYSEIPTVVKQNDVYIVYDGNRRVAILKYLNDPLLRDSLMNSLKLEENQKSLLDIKTIPCNVCDIETALSNVERKHSESGDWGRLERDYFMTTHRKENKSYFILIDEQTDLISSKPFLNKRFVKEEVLIPEVLNEIGLDINSQQGLLTIYDQKTTKQLLDHLASLVKDKKVSTRKNRKNVLKPMIESYPELKETIKPYKAKKGKRVDLKEKDNLIPFSKPQKKRRTSTKKEVNQLFGKKLYLKNTRVNNLYMAIDKVYEQNKNNDTVLPIIAMSLRLLLEIGAREYYKENGTNDNDQLYKDFLKLAKKNMLEKRAVNYLALTEGWLNSKIKLDGVLGKYAHGNIIVTKNDILEKSQIIGDIINFYFKK